MNPRKAGRLLPAALSVVTTLYVAAGPVAAAGAGPNGPQPTGSASITTFASPGFEAANSTAAPGARTLAMLAYDTPHGVNVLFGGKGNTTWYSDTWTWQGTTWTKQAPTSSPSSRDGGAMAFDTATGKTYLFGGLSATTGAALGDTWSWDGTNWTKLTVTGPSARYDAKMVYDSTIGKLVLFGGYDGTSIFSETWTFDGTTWTKLAPVAHPTARANPAIAFDSRANLVVLFGGDNGTQSSIYGDTWTFDGATWTQQSPAHTPGQRTQAGFAYDPTLTRNVLFGGKDGASTDADVWLWSGTDWLLGVSPNAPSARTSPALETGASNGQLVVFGGADSSGTAQGDTYVYDWLKLGEQRGYNFETSPIDDREHVHVNVGNGNLVFHASDLHIAGVGLSFSFERHYNAQDSLVSSELGFGWSFDNGRDVYLSPLPDGSQVLFGLYGAGGQIVFHHNSDGSFTPPAGVDAKLSTAGSNYQLVFNKSSEKMTFGPGLLTSDADRNGNSITYTYNAGQQLSSVTDTQGRHVTFTYNGDGTLAQITDPTNRTWKYTYGSGFLQTFTDPAGAITQYSYDGAHRLATIADPVGNVSAIHYDTFGRTTAVIRDTSPTSGSGPTTTYTYSQGDSNTYWTKTASTDANAHTTTYQSDYAATPRKITDARGNSQSNAYTADNNIISLTDRISNAYTLGWDNSNNLTSIQAPGGPSVTATFGNAAHPFQPDSSTDAQGNCTSYSYDPAGNLTQVSPGQQPPSGSTCQNAIGTVVLRNAYQGDTGVTCGAKPGELCSSTDGNGHVTSYAYDPNGNAITITPPAPLGATTVVPDGLGRPSSVTDGKSQKTTYGYDGNDRITQLLFGGATTCATTAGTCIKYTYDGAGNLKSRVDVTGTTSYTYDFENRVLSKNTPAGNSSVTYDGVGNVATFTDASGTVTYTYDADNNVQDVVEPGGTTTLCGTSGTLCTLFKYDKENRPTSVAYPNGVNTTIVYNTAGQEMSTASAIGTGSPFLKRVYTYVAGARNTALRQTMTDESGTLTTYRYDPVNRLLSATSSASSYSYVYDAAGNATSIARAGFPTATYGYNSADEINSTGWSFDANGNVTTRPVTIGNQTYSYNSLNQTTSITTGATPLAMSYADVGQTERTAAGAATFLNGLLGVTRQSGASTLAFTRTPAGSLVSMRTGSAHFYYILDGIGSVIGLTDSSGALAANYAYDPFGNTVNVGGAQQTVNPFRFASGYFDTATGLTKFGTRYYDSTVGRWTQQEAIGGSISDPGNVDRYLYVGDSPVSLTDPNGMAGTFALSFSACGIICGQFALSTSGSASFFSYGLGIGPSGGADVSLTYSPAALQAGPSSEIDCSALGGTLSFSGETLQPQAGGLTSATEAGCAAFVMNTVQVGG